ncbi:MAG: glycine cleavage system aminomethyltransferase GcvT [Gammaproteobacteria bacterium]|nr:glycine cleavage system aminomethyltransferase GcvT [Gammaproteobacteria bacterium]
MTKRTPLYASHVDVSAKMVDFAGWQMPLNYGSQINEHHVVRRAAGMFDVSHMTVIDVSGSGSVAFLRRMVASDVARLSDGKALYGTLLNDAGGVVDDLIVYRRSHGYRAVVNAATRDEVLAWFAHHAPADVVVEERDLSMIAVQGPRALEYFQAVTHLEGIIELRNFGFLEHNDWMIARTGYTGEDGLEVILPKADVCSLWERLMDVGVEPIGLAARDTLRLEAGLNLYCQDMDVSTSPLVSNLAWTVSWQPENREFIGRRALEAERAAGITEKLTGLVMEARGVLRHGQRVLTNYGDGVITSGIFSPTLGYSIALARLPISASGDCQVEIRGKLLPVRITKPPFVRRGQPVFE